MPVSKFLNLSTDTTLGGENPSDFVIPSEKAIKTYVQSTISTWTYDNTTETLEIS